MIFMNDTGVILTKPIKLRVLYNTTANTNTIITTKTREQNIFSELRSLNKLNLLLVTNLLRAVMIIPVHNIDICFATMERKE